MTSTNTRLTVSRHPADARHVHSHVHSMRVPAATSERPQVARTVTRMDTLLTITDVADTLQVSRRTLNRLRADDPTFPPPIYVGQSPRWAPADVREWVAQQRAATRPEPGSRIRV